MSVEGIVKDKHGYDFEVQIHDRDAKNEIKDISSFTTIEYDFFKPDGTKVTKTGSFITSGSDGLVKYNVEEDVIDTNGEWMLIIRIESGSVKLATDPPITFTV